MIYERDCDEKQSRFFFDEDSFFVWKIKNDV